MLQPGHDHVACPRTQFFPQPRQVARSGSTATSNSACPGCTALKQKRIASGLTPVRTPIRTQTRRSRVLSGFTCSAVRRMLSTIEASCMHVPQPGLLSLSTRVTLGAPVCSLSNRRGACRTRTLQIAEWPVSNKFGAPCYGLLRPVGLDSWSNSVDGLHAARDCGDFRSPMCLLSSRGLF